MIKGVFLDLCGTLLVYGDMDEAWAHWLETGYRCFKQSGLHCTIREFEQACDGLFSQPAPEPADDGLTVYERRLNRLANQIGIKMSVTQLQETAMATVRTWADRMYPDPECMSLLEALKKRVYLGLITNYDHPPYIEMALDKHGLRPFFNQVIISGQVGFNKPDPRIFRLALARSGLQPDEVIYAGDSLKEDIAGAQAAGIRPVFILRDPLQLVQANDYRSSAARKQVLPDNRGAADVYTIRRLSDLLDLI